MEGPHKVWLNSVTSYQRSTVNTGGSWGHLFTA
jgi:hypothetical protein